MSSVSVERLMSAFDDGGVGRAMVYVGMCCVLCVCVCGRRVYGDFESMVLWVLA